jgi:hypothetical protein
MYTFDWRPADGELYPDVLELAGEGPLLCLDSAEEVPWLYLDSATDRPTRIGLLGAGALKGRHSGEN